MDKQESGCESLNRLWAKSLDKDGQLRSWNYLEMMKMASMKCQQEQYYKRTYLIRYKN